jgi:hypothetical protein
VALSDPSSELRCSDAEREQAAGAIREHYAAGRLDDEELGQRLEAIYAARTVGQLAELQRDLPALPTSVSTQRAELAERRRMLQRRLVQQSGGGVCLFAVCTAIWAASGHRGGFWPVWILIVVLVPLLRNGWRMYGPAPDLDRVEAELERRERHARRRSRRARRHAQRL